MLNFKTFLLEKIELSKNLEEFDVEDKGNGKFTVNIDNVERQFSVLPLPDDTNKYNELFFKLNDSITKKNPSSIYKTLVYAESLPYDFGHLISASVSLSNVSGLDLALTDSQKTELQTSPEIFLDKQFTSLSKTLRNNIMKYLYDTAKIYAIVLESMFYYMRTGDKKEFYDSMNFFSILKEYQDVIMSIDKEAEGPVDNEGASINSEIEYAYWKIVSKNTDKTYFLRATTSPELLNSEENMTGTKGLNVSVLNSDKGEIRKDLNNVPLFELSNKLKRLH